MILNIYVITLSKNWYAIVAFGFANVPCDFAVQIGHRFSHFFNLQWSKSL